MEFISLLYEPRVLQATEKNLQAVYNAAKLGLKGDALALTAGMQPIELRQLMEFDPAVSMAAQKGAARLPQLNPGFAIFDPCELCNLLIS